MLKLEVLTNLVTESNISVIFREFQVCDSNNKDNVYLVILYYLPIYIFIYVIPLILGS